MKKVDMLITNLFLVIGLVPLPSACLFANKLGTYESHQKQLAFQFLGFLSECPLVAYFCLANPEGLGKEIGRLGLSNVPTRKLQRGKDQFIWWATLRDDKEKHYSLKDSVRSFSF